MAFGGNLFARDEIRFTLLVITDCKETQTTIDTDNMTDVPFLKLFDRFCNRDMEIP